MLPLLLVRSDTLKHEVKLNASNISPASPEQSKPFMLISLGLKLSCEDTDITGRALTTQEKISIPDRWMNNMVYLGRLVQNKLWMNGVKWRTWAERFLHVPQSQHLSDYHRSCPSDPQQTLRTAAGRAEHFALRCAKHTNNQSTSKSTLHTDLCASWLVNCRNDHHTDQSSLPAD